MTDGFARPSLTVGDARYGAQRSRRLLIETISTLAEFRNAITVVGAHAVHAWVERAWGKTAMETTRDGDLVINPVFVTEEPKLIDLMARVGISPALVDRPGIYGLTAEAGLEWSTRTTVDLLVPEVYAGGGRRAARIPGQKNATSRAVGLELAIWDRHLTQLTTIDEPSEGIDACIAGPAALLTAKAHKVHERMAAIASRPHRVKPKDSGDVALLMMVADPETTAETMVDAVEVHPEVADVVGLAASWLIDLYGDPNSLARRHSAESLAARFEEKEIFDAIDRWLTVFHKGVETITTGNAKLAATVESTKFGR